jgi:hypothetical protein
VTVQHYFGPTIFPDTNGLNMKKPGRMATRLFTDQENKLLRGCSSSLLVMTMTLLVAHVLRGLGRLGILCESGGSAEGNGNSKSCDDELLHGRNPEL